MERLTNCETIMDIETIDSISGANEFFEVLFTAKDKAKYKIVLERVWDMRYSIENASIDRFIQFRSHSSECLINNSFYLVENSEYIRYFETQISGTYPTDELKHYIFVDFTDTTLDVLTLKKPMLVKID